MKPVRNMVALKYGNTGCGFFKRGIQNWNFGTFWHLPVTIICKILMIIFDYSWFLAKTFLILYPSLENSTTGIAIPWSIGSQKKCKRHQKTSRACKWLLSRHCRFRSWKKKSWYVNTYIFCVKYAELEPNSLLICDIKKNETTNSPIYGAAKRPESFLKLFLKSY